METETRNDKDTANSFCWEFDQDNKIGEAHSASEKHVLHIQYPIMKGAIYLTDNGKTVISNCEFSSNDAGPILDNSQMIGLKSYKAKHGPDQIVDVRKMNRATAIFSDHDDMDITI